MEILPGYVDMALTPPEKKEEYPSTPSAPMYPYGLCISLGTEQLKKLGLDDGVEAGDHIDLHAIGKVTSVSIRDVDGSEPDHRVEIQLIAIECEDEDKEAEEMAQEIKAPKKISYKKMYGGA